MALQVFQFSAITMAAENSQRNAEGLISYLAFSMVELLACDWPPPGPLIDAPCEASKVLSVDSRREDVYQHNE